MIRQDLHPPLQRRDMPAILPTVVTVHYYIHVNANYKMSFGISKLGPACEGKSYYDGRISSLANVDVI